MKPKLVSVIMVNYNGGEFVLQCVESVLQSSRSQLELLVVDNCSTDGSIEKITERFGKHGKVKVISNTRNLGYSAAINLGSQEARGDYLAIINNDVLPRKDWLDRPVDLMEEDDSVAAVQPLMMFYDEPSLVNDAGHFIDRFGIVYARDSSSLKLPITTEIEIFGATGAAIIVRREVFDKLGGFDSDFFMLFEETDFCWRVWLSGGRVIFVPTSIVYHKARASYRLRLKVSYLFNRNRLCSMLKNYDGKSIVKFVPVNLSLILGTGLYMLYKSDSTVILENVKAILWNLSNLSSTLQKRSRTRRLKTTPEKQLLNAGIVRQSNIGGTLRRLLEAA